ncbi:hypothetical protein GCM10011390_43660 [Aureimonas endophytica]|uniref:CopG family transcriptional regulator n=1 Tax=Aureimonas endophytica TaxID=2027858 RepID=A0A917EAR5_9HYPH|nr:type II toxin-antitoxin system ParD family antitoxin [Aureimonas endophytica]GGE19676.1 hypothetical protein GCM10011390_43660 [Aureimonas endophytica]
MATIEIIIPEKMLEWVRAQVEEGFYVDAGDYIRHLIRNDQMVEGEEFVELVEFEEALNQGLLGHAEATVIEAEEVAASEDEGKPSGKKQGKKR